MRSTAITIAVLILLLVGGYLGAYYALVAPLSLNALLPSGNGIVARPAYLLDSPIIGRALEPAHQLDRLIRPGRWAVQVRGQAPIEQLSEPTD